MADHLSVRRPHDQGSAPAFSSYLEARRAAFADPWDVVLDPNLTCDEKLEILTDWVSAAQADKDLPGEQMGATGEAAWRHDLMEGLRLVEAEIAALSDKRAVTRPGHLKPAPRSRSLHAA